MRRLREATNIEYIKFMVEQYPKQTILYEDGYEIEEDYVPEQLCERFQTALKACLNTLYANKDSVNSWWHDRPGNFLKIQFGKE